MSTHSCTIIHASLITDLVSRRLLLPSIQAALKSPFHPSLHTVIPPHTALCNFNQDLLLFFIGFLIWVILYYNEEIMSRSFIILSFPIFYNSRYHRTKRSCCLWQHRHLAQKASEKLAFQNAFMCKVFPSLCDGNLLVL